MGKKKQKLKELIESQANNTLPSGVLLQKPSPQQVRLSNISEKCEKDSTIEFQNMDTVKDSTSSARVDSVTSIADIKYEQEQTHIFLYCVHCISMVMIMTGEKVPFSIFMDTNIQEKSILVGTSCRTCKKKHSPQCTNPLESLHNYSKTQAIQFQVLNISSKLLESSDVHKIAKAAAQRDVTILRGKNDCLIYESTDTILNEMNNKCYVLGIDTSVDSFEDPNAILKVFLPGGFF